MKIHVPTVLKQMTEKKSIAEKLMLLGYIQGHPLHPFIIDMVTKVMDIGMKKNLPTQDMIDQIDVCLEMMVEKFEAVKQY